MQTSAQDQTAATATVVTRLRAAPGPDDGSVELLRVATGTESVLLSVPQPVILEVAEEGCRHFRRVCAGYSDIQTDVVGQAAIGLVGTTEVTAPDGARYAVTDQWLAVDERHWRLDRRMEVRSASPASGVRLVLEAAPQVPGGARFEDFRYFAPGAMCDLNDLDGDFVDDYADTQTLVYREDRLTAMSVLAHHKTSGLALAFSRADPPEFDPTPERAPGQTGFRQRTDVGSVGVFPAFDHNGCLLTGAYPFVERDRSHALLVSDRPGWGAFWPAEAGDVLTVSYLIAVYDAATPHEALWSLWQDRIDQLRPRPVTLPASLAEITAHRVDALLAYYAEDDAMSAAGFVTNCHPQDGRQLGNVVQYGFTGQNVLNAYCLLRDESNPAEADERRRRALHVIDFYVQDARRNRHGLVHALYDMDRSRHASWWTGLLLPLAYAEPGDDLERLMGPLYEHLRPVIEALQQREGTYLRCLAEEYDALLQAYQSERERGTEHAEWLGSATAFGDFLAQAQEADGSWYRAYDLDGAPMTEPDIWFGQTDVQRKSSTATVVPLLLRLHGLTGEQRWLQVAARACEWVDRYFVEGLKFNGGIHDSMYARPQLIDHESIIFAFRALLEMYRSTGEQHYLDEATKAGWIVCTWAWLWDVPLPQESTLARFGFRSTGWTGCDTPGAGYVHPMGVVVVPDLVEVARHNGDPTFVRVAELILAACNETVALPGKDWGYARPGLQEEGHLISWCWADDPMFTGTEFGGRRKGEGNKTCFPWISAVTIWAYQELLTRYGTTDVSALSPSR